MSDTLLEMEDLRVTFPTRTGVVEAVRGVSFSLGRERLGIVGESGSGKSQTGRAIMGLTPPQARISAKKLAFDGIDLLAASPGQRRTLRGKRIAMIASGRRFVLDQWWVAGVPGFAILIVSLGFNLLGDGLRDALDPRSSEQ